MMCQGFPLKDINGILNCGTYRDWSMVSIILNFLGFSNKIVINVEYISLVIIR